MPEGRCDLYCGESGSTLRFLLPIAGALGAQAVFHREGRLPQRPLAPLDSVLKEHGMTLREDGDLLYCSGQLIGETIRSQAMCPLNIFRAFSWRCRC